MNEVKRCPLEKKQVPILSLPYNSQFEARVILPKY